MEVFFNMIFVTVGTHEQPFDRLVAEVDRLVEHKVINEKVVIQRGYSKYQPQFCQFADMMDVADMDRFMSEARLIICHGGPATFMRALSMGKRTIVVPRQQKYNEHINDHQLIFSRQVRDAGYQIEIVDEISKLKDVIAETSNLKDFEYKSHNSSFISKLEKAVDSL